MANVQPVHPVEGTQWNHEAINKFEELTHGKKKKTFSIVSFIELIFFMNCVISVAKWKKLTAKTVKTRERFRGYDANQKESSTIPGIELYDIIDGTVFFNKLNELMNKFHNSFFSSP